MKKYLLKENTKHITKFLKLLKNANYRKKISKHVERNIYKCTKVYSILNKKRKKQTKCNTQTHECFRAGDFCWN